MFVESAFYREQHDPWPVATPAEQTGFGHYYSTASLFERTGEPLEKVARSDGPYAVLGVTRDDSWHDIKRSHRRLVSELHPDRFVGADAALRESAERRVRDVNEAFSEIRRERADQGL